MPNFSGIWTVTQQMQARGASTWPAAPGAPIIGTATAGVSLCASVAFTAPVCTGYPTGGITAYRVISTPGCITQTGASSPLVVSGLTSGTSYTFKAQATNSIGYGALSAASNSITAALVTCATYTTTTGGNATFSWVAPAGVTSVAVVAVGYGYSSGGGLGYKNNIAVTPGTSYPVFVSGYGGCCSGSYFISAATVRGGRGLNCSPGTYTGDGGGNGGYGNRPWGAGGAGGYSGNGGAGRNSGSGDGFAGSGGGGGGGASAQCGSGYCGGSGGGGVGLFGQGANGAGGIKISAFALGGGGGGSGGASAATATAGNGSSGGLYGGGPTGGNTASAYSGGAVRIVWAGGSRGTPSFPSTNVGA